MKRPRSMKRVLLDLHLYTSLICAPYLVLYGVSTLGQNHAWGREATSQASGRWERVIELPPSADRAFVIRSARDALGLIGNLPGGSFGASTPDSVQFEVRRPFRWYRVGWNRATGVATVVETNKGFWNGLQGLHGMMGLQGTWWVRVWGLYTWFSVLSLTFSVLSGLYLWWGRLRERRVGIALLAAGSGGSLLFILYLIL